MGPGAERSEKTGGACARLNPFPLYPPLPSSVGVFAVSRRALISVHLPRTAAVSLVEVGRGAGAPLTFPARRLIVARNLVNDLPK